MGEGADEILAPCRWYLRHVYKNLCNEAPKTKEVSPKDIEVQGFLGIFL